MSLSLQNVALQFFNQPMKRSNINLTKNNINLTKNSPHFDSNNEPEMIFFFPNLPGWRHPACYLLKNTKHLFSDNSRSFVWWNLRCMQLINRQILPQCISKVYLHQKLSFQHFYLYSIDLSVQAESGPISRMNFIITFYFNNQFKGYKSSVSEIKIFFPN